MAECHPPPQHARAAEKVERRAQRQRTQEPTGVAESGVNRERRTSLAGSAHPALPAVSDDESDQIRIAYKSTSAAAPAYGSAAIPPSVLARADEIIE